MTVRHGEPGSDGVGLGGCVVLPGLGEGAEFAVLTALSVGEKPSLVALNPGWYQLHAPTTRLRTTTVAIV